MASDRLEDAGRAVVALTADATFGHAGDGNFHPMIVSDPSDDASSTAARSAFQDIVRTATALGGTITGEHGVGVLKRDLLAEVADPAALAVMGRIRRAFDPHGILNPGKAC